MSANRGVCARGHMARESCVAEPVRHEQRNKESQRDELLLSDTSIVVFTERNERLQRDSAGDSRSEAVCVRDYFGHRQLFLLHALFFVLAMKLRHSALAFFVRPDGSNVSDLAGAACSAPSSAPNRVICAAPLLTALCCTLSVHGIQRDSEKSAATSDGVSAFVYGVRAVDGVSASV